MEVKFKIGDTVCLKSGSPSMTVTENKEEIVFSGPSHFSGNVVCTWFAGKEQKFGQFPQDALELE